MNQQNEFISIPTQYAKVDGINIAFQVIGSGPVDIVYIPGWISNMDWMWACPELVAFFKELSKVSRIILFDKRGTGLSDRIIHHASLEERMEDIKAVMDAAGSDKAILFGHSEGGSVSLLFSATYPNRVNSLIMFGVFAKRRYSKDYPWAPTDDEREKLYDMIKNRWGSGQMPLEILAPSKANCSQFMSWLTNYFRSGASPNAALKLTQMNTSIDIIDVLEHVNVPALIMQRIDDVNVKFEEGEFIADRMPNATFKKLKGADHLFWIGDTKPILNSIKDFVTQTQHNAKFSNQLYTILLAKLENTHNSLQVNEKINQIANRFDAIKILQQTNEYRIVFKASGKSLECAITIRNHLEALQADARIGIFMKQGDLNSSPFFNDKERMVIERISAKIDLNQILCSQSVKKLISNGTHEFIPHTSIWHESAKRTCMLYQVHEIEEDSYKVRASKQMLSNDVFLKEVLKIIYHNIDNELFSVEFLSKEMRLSERQLQRKIKALTNKSPSQLILSTRLCKAKQALLVENDTVSRIAFQYGFSSPSYFSKCFKKEFGVRPTTIKRVVNKKYKNFQLQYS